jgi:hypothetical protein
MPSFLAAAAAAADVAGGGDEAAVVVDVEEDEVEDEEAAVGVERVTFSDAMLSCACGGCVLLVGLLGRTFNELGLVAFFGEMG